jgi:threonyl-tRNA synthetase
MEIVKKHLLLAPGGKEYPIILPVEGKGRDLLTLLESLGDEALRSYVLAEEIKRGPGEEPPSTYYMRKLELVDYEPAADSGHFRFYPKGSLIYDLLIAWAYEIAVNRFGAMKIETPLIYDWSQPDIRDQGQSFHERHYTVSAPGENEKEWVLRFAGDFGLFRMIKEARLSYRHLPLRVYELSKSFRYEKSGELSGLKRLRAFTMPDIHSFTRNLEEGWQEYIRLYRHYDDLAKATEVEYAIVFRIVESFYRKHRDKISEMLDYSGRPAFIELLSEMKHYWVVKHEFQGIDSVGGTCQLSTVQLDVVDSERYGIVYIDSNGSRQGCIICHSSIGSVERWIYSIMEHALKREKAVLPLWLSPVQLRLLPVSDKHVEHCLKLCRRFRSAKLRCDVDDRSITLGRKITHARQAWIPYEAVVGDREKQDSRLSIRSREDDGKMLLAQEELISHIRGKCDDMPWKELWLDERCSRQPIFRG